MKKLVLVLLFVLLLVGCSKQSEWENYGYLQDDDILIFPTSDTMVKFDFDTLNQEILESKDQGVQDVIVKMEYGSAKFTGYGTLKVQGSSTAKHPKKNWTLKLYSDKERTETLYIKMGDSIPSDKWILKADWVDPSHLRNPLSYNIWNEMTLSRDRIPRYEVDHAWYSQDGLMNQLETGAKGFPQVHLASVTINEEHYGISNFLLGKDLENYNVDKHNDHHMLLEFDGRGGYTDEKTWDKFSVEGIDQWVDMLSPKAEELTEEQTQAINNLSRLFNGDIDYFKENFDKHLDRQNIIDMLLFLEVTYDTDAYAQDIYMVTYDLEKWYFLPWDKDTTFAMSWRSGVGLLEDVVGNLVINYDVEENSQKPWYKTYHSFTEDVEARYAELRDKGVFSVDTIYDFSKSYHSLLTEDIWKREIERWDEHNRGALNQTSIGQISRWFELRLQVLDEHFNYE